MTQTGGGQDCLGFRVSGRIQGVGFRAWVQRQALRLRITGWVRNEADGTVSCECRGTQEALEAFTEALRRGPPLARIDKIDTCRVSGTAASKRFEILY